MVASTVAALLLLSLVTFSYPKGGESSPAANEVNQTIIDKLHSIDGYFIENRGQVADGIRYYLRGNPSVAFRDDGVMFVLTQAEREKDSDRPTGSGFGQSIYEVQPLRTRRIAYVLQFDGANRVTPAGRGHLSFGTNFFIGSAPGKWTTDVPSFREVVYADLYDRIDLVYRASQDGVKYEFVVKPGGNPGNIVMVYEGVSSVQIDGTRLIIRTALADVVDDSPHSYEENGREVACRHAVRGSSATGFDCEIWDTRRTLIIDPLVYSTYLGGGGDDIAYSLAVDSEGNAYITGMTHSSDFPTTPGSYDTSYDATGGWPDIFVSKLNATGSSLVYSTFIGGSNYELGDAIAIDSSGNAYITGSTFSTNFPTTPGAYDRSLYGASDAYVTKLNSAGNALVYSTYLGGEAGEHMGDYGHTIAVDSDGNAYVGGYTGSSDYPTTPGAFNRTYMGGRDGFVTKLNPSGSGLVYSTYLPGSGWDHVLSITLDQSRNAYVAGGTYSADFPTTPGAFDTTLNWTFDAFVAKLNQFGSDLIYSTFLGGNSMDNGYSIAIDSSNNSYITGVTTSSDFPVTEGCFDPSYNNVSAFDLFVTKLNQDGSGLVYSTFLGGNGSEDWPSLAVDSAGIAYLTGGTSSNDFPVTPDAFQKSINNRSDAFVTRINETGGSILYSTFLGGSGVPVGSHDQGSSIALDNSGAAYVAGDTWAPDFPVTSGAYDTTFNGGLYDAFVAKIGFEAHANTPPAISSFTATIAAEGSPVTFTVSANDAEGDLLTYYFDFESDGIFDVVGPNNTVTHVYGDDFGGKAIVKVTDSQLSAEACTTVTVANVPPSGTVSIPARQREGTTIGFSTHITDPGSDDLFLTWSWGDGTPSKTSTYYNNGASPDPYPSTDIHPRDVTDLKTHTYGDNGAFTVTVFAKDDDSGSQGTTLTITATPDNLSPSVQVSGGMSVDEGQSITLAATANDSGSDDLTFAWSWGEGTSESRIYYNNGVSPDPPMSPRGIYPFTASDIATHTYGDNGVYILTLTVTDDDGGSTSLSTEITVVNLPPSIVPFGPFTLNEGDPLTIASGATDPGSDDLTFTWQWDYGPTQTTVFYNDGVGPDPPLSPAGTYPFTAADSSSHTYGDDCNCIVTLTVTDDDGGTTTYSTTVTVLNIPPSLVGQVEAYARGSLILRVAGEKWHDVTATVYLNGVEKFTATMVRTPGSPDDQAVTIGDIVMDLMSGDGWSAKVVYTPMDDPINGQIWGADPAWIIFRSEHANESSLHHTFNVRHEETWTWEVPSLKALLISMPLDFRATANDPGSDDLTFKWEWGDGTPDTTTTYYNDGIGPDKYPSPGGTFPFTATDVCVHTYAMTGTYAVTLSIMDDDGGGAVIKFTVEIGG